MVACLIGRPLLKKVVLFGAAFCMINLLALRYFANEALETVDLSYLQGRNIVIDAGHGGIDSGARYNNLLEKDITLAISLKLGELLQAQGATVQYTRDGDQDYYTKGKGGKRNDLLTRIDMINQSGADLFVSVHCNAVKGEQWFGSQVFYNPKSEKNKRLAELMQALLKKYPPNNKRMEKEDQKILILKSAQIPGVLLETGYLSNPKEAALLSDQTYQAALAGQVVKALACYMKEAGV